LRIDLVEHRETTDGVERLVPCLTMQLLDGRTLASALSERRPMTPEAALPLIRQMVQAVAIMHEKGIVHRDIKPSNIMLVDDAGGADGRAVVMDFGLAKPLSERSVYWESRTVDRAGAPYFIAPEVLRGERGGTAVDIYALGLVIDEMVTGSPAFPNDSIEELFWKKLHADPIPPSQRSDHLPAAWEETILRCLERDPGRRPPSAAAVLHSLSNEPGNALEPARAVPAPLPEPRPESVGRAPEVPARSFRVARLTRRTLLGAGAGSILIPGLAAVFSGRPSQVHTAMLVYPFANLTRQPEYDYLCAGTADELMRRLVYLDGLSVFQVREARAGKLPGAGDVPFSLEGDLQHHGERVRLTVQLIDNRSGALVWTDQFERELRDPLALESEIAEKLVVALISRLQQQHGGFGSRVQAATESLGSPIRRWLGRGISLLPSQATSSSAAFVEYIQGRQIWQNRTLKDTLTAIQHFQRALALDARFALAYSALADAQYALMTYDYDDGQRLLEDARRYAVQAVALDSSLPEVHVSLGAVQQALWDWPGSEAAYRRAIQAQPKFARAHAWFGGLLLQFGRFDEALAEARRGLELDPFDYPNQSTYGFYLWHAGRLREAAAHLEALLAKTDLLYAHTVLGQVYAALAASSAEPESTDFFVRSLREAGIVRTREFDAAGGNDNAGFLKWSDTVFAQAHAARGDRASARLYVERLEHGFRSGVLSASVVAWAQAAVGNHERALELLEIGLPRHEREILNIKVTPLFRPLHHDARFQAILRQMGL
jgi:TolB-like protein/tetratricopeptide (TPR) repeat protein